MELDLEDLRAVEGTSWRHAGLVREAPVEELPREPLRHGPAVLSDAEGLALVLTRGAGDAAALLRADEILAAHQRLPGLVSLRAGGDSSSTVIESASTGFQSTTPPKREKRQG